MQSLTNQVAHIEHTQFALTEVEHSGNFSENTPAVELERINNELKTSFDSLSEAKSQLEEKLSVAEQRILVLEEEKLRTDLLVHNQERELSESNEALRTARENCLRLQNQVTELPKVAIHNSYRAFLNSVCQRACDLLEELLTHFAQSELLLMHKTTPEFLFRSAQNSHAKLSQVETHLRNKTGLNSNNPELPLLISDLSVRFYEMLFHCKVLRQFVPDFLEFPDPDVICHNLIDLFQHLGADRSDVVFDDQIVTIRHDTERLMNAVEQFQRLQDRGQFDEQQIADQLELEMRATANAIRTAEEKFKELFARPTGCLSEDQLRVKHIFNYCSALMIAVGRLVEAANNVQKELKNDNNVSEFYKQHSRWTQGFLSAAKSVGACANVLVEASDVVAGGDAGSLGRMIVVAQEVAVSTTHLFVASRIKINPNSANLIALKNASREVTEATGTLVASVKAEIDTHEAEGQFPFFH
ncbi:hypothetical protein FBUS_02009 [Fasciolopsis buskii]|uniref:I/LWEQ domain-containing protein n=1 Tax=Fasciolopsis buskii TaxID=27845 RepID=A0A8E0RSN1_9TREM|nr:hypothetical protein FBUS_02009 [Fasciolopsis buski]